MSEKQNPQPDPSLALPPEYLTVDYAPLDHDNPIPARGGARRPTQAEVDQDSKYVAAAGKEE